MSYLRCIIILTISVLFQFNSGSCQVKAAKKHANIEIKADTLQSIDQNLYWGIAGDTGTILDKKYFVINHNDDVKIVDWIMNILEPFMLQIAAKEEKIMEYSHE